MVVCTILFDTVQYNRTSITVTMIQLWPVATSIASRDQVVFCSIGKICTGRMERPESGKPNTPGKLEGMCASKNTAMCQ